VELKLTVLRKDPAPGIVNDHHCAKLGRLYHRLNLPAVIRSSMGSPCQVEIYSALFVAVATLEESVCVEESLQSVFCCPTLEEFLPDGFRHEHD